MRDGHPKPDLLLRFLVGRAGRAEGRAVVRHLLAGCRECQAATRRVWELGEERPKPRPRPRAVEPCR
jgi:hypothetical protein